MRSSKRPFHHEDVAGLRGDRPRRETLPHPAIARVHNPPALVLNEDLRGAQDVPGRQEPAARAVHFERGVERVRLRECAAQAMFVQPGGLWRGDDPAMADGVVAVGVRDEAPIAGPSGDRKSTRLNSSHLVISYAVFCLKKKKKK